MRGTPISGQEHIALRPLLAQATARLSEANVDSPRVDVEVLAAFAFGAGRADLITLDYVDASAVDRFSALVDQRAQRVPLQHLTGRAGFRYLELRVGPGVFVPRPETELLVQWGLEALRAPQSSGSGSRPVTVVDLCAGSGAIALSMAHELPTARVCAVEREAHAVAWLEMNAKDRLAAGDEAIEIHHADATSPSTLEYLNGTVDLIVSNPPYVPLGASVAPEAGDHDPAAALWGGRDGLDVVRGIVNTAARLLRPGGWCGFEHGEQQARETVALFSDASTWSNRTSRQDLAGRPRFTCAQRKMLDTPAP